MFEIIRWWHYDHAVTLFTLDPLELYGARDVLSHCHPLPDCGPRRPDYSWPKTSVDDRRWSWSREGIRAESGCGQDSGWPLPGECCALLSSPAVADDKETLLQDVKAFMERCDGKTKETLSPSCANEWTELHRRQNALHLSNEDVNGTGGLHSGGKGPWW